MRTAEPHRLLGRLLRAVAAAALALGTALGGLPALAQSTDSAEDPPGRVGRISYLSGPVELIDLRDGSSEAATMNWPITSGFRLATGRLGRAEVHIGSLSVLLDDDTEVDFTRIDDAAIQINALSGSVALRVRNRELLSELDVLTPRERIVIEDAGRYRIDVDRVPSTTSVTAFSGQARVLSGRMIYTVPAGQRGDIEAVGQTASFRLGAPLFDPFDDWIAARDRRDERPRSAQYVSPEMTGGEALDDHGTWRRVETYGAVWFPSYVPDGWAPYRYGRWAYIPPWGWTWIDDAPWGFAPFHYGRWASINGAWGWIPGVYVPRPVYAPALVVWLGSPGVSVSIGIGAPIGWFPLGPHEVFIPPYRCSRRHVNFVNVPHVANITNITVINPPPRYVHRDPNRTTWVPGSALVGRGPVHRVVMPPPADWSNRMPSPRPPIEAPREIKKRPTPVTMPGRGRFDRPEHFDRPQERAPSPPQSSAPQPGAAPAPAVPVQPMQRRDDLRDRAPRVDREPRGDDLHNAPRARRPEVPGRTPMQEGTGPSPAVPFTPRAAPPSERGGAADDTDRMRRPIPPRAPAQPEPAPRAAPPGERGAPAADADRVRRPAPPRAPARIEAAPGPVVPRAAPPPDDADRVRRPTPTPHGRQPIETAPRGHEPERDDRRAAPPPRVAAQPSPAPVHVAPQSPRAEPSNGHGPRKFGDERGPQERVERGARPMARQVP